MLSFAAVCVRVCVFKAVMLANKQTYTQWDRDFAFSPSQIHLNVTAE